MMRKLIKLLLATTVCWPVVATAGVFSGGGGELIKDSANPWFLQNSRTVKTCIILDEEVFHTASGDSRDVRTALHAALGYWKKEFAKAWSVGGVIQVATQDFVDGPMVLVSSTEIPERGCPADTDITFQFGWLSTTQRHWLVKQGHQANSLVGIAVRTDYDAVNMRAKGFVFIAGDQGPWAIKGADVVSRPWQRQSGLLLTEVLKHELGHVFGIPHMGVDGPMAVDYPERILHPSNALATNNSGEEQPFFKIEAPFTLRSQCSDGHLRQGWRDFLGTPPSDHCLVVSLQQDRIVFSTGPSLDQMQVRGRMVFAGPERYSWQDAGRIYAPREQRAFPCPDPLKGAGQCPWLLGPMIKIVDRAGTFTSVDDTLTRQVAVTLSPLGVGFAQAKFNVEIDGVWHWNLDWEY